MIVHVILMCLKMPGKKTTKLWVPDDEVSPETLAKVRDFQIHLNFGP